MVNKFKLEKSGLLIYPKLFSNNDGNNINGPSLIKVPKWIKSPLGKYGNSIVIAFLLTSKNTSVHETRYFDLFLVII